MVEGDVNIERLKKDVSAAVEALDENPIYHLSLGSRELFHSNFLAWMIKKFPAAGQKIFGIDGNNLTVERENYNLDLAITYEKGGKKHVLVVEVKVKDTPRRDQLAKYGEKIERHFKEYEKRKFLLSLVPLEEKEPSSTGWTYMSFADLSTKVNEFFNAPNLVLGPSAESMIQLYADLCRKLQDIVDKTTQADERLRTFLWPKPESWTNAKYFDDQLDSIRFQDTLNKQRAGKLRDAIEEKFGKIPDPKSGRSLTLIF